MIHRDLPRLAASRWLAPLLLAALGVASLPGRAEEPQQLVLTTDTPQYCVQLGRDVAARRSQVAEVQHLLSEGREMCERGQIRGGILRLRRALVMLHHRAVDSPKP